MSHILILYTDEIPLNKGIEKPLEYFHERIPDCFGTILTDNQVLTEATCVTNYKKYTEYNYSIQLFSYY